MYSNQRKGKGSVGVEVFQGRLRLRLSRQLFDGKQKYLTLGLPDTDAHRRVAGAKARLMDIAIALGNCCDGADDDAGRIREEISPSGDLPENASPLYKLISVPR